VLNTYRSALTDYNKHIRDAKRDSWRKFCGTINDLPDTSRIHKILSRKPKQDPGSIKRSDGSYTATRKEMTALQSGFVKVGLFLRIGGPPKL